MGFFPAGKIRRKVTLSIDSTPSLSATGHYKPAKPNYGKRIIRYIFNSNMPFVTSSLGGLSRGIMGVVKPHFEVLKGLDLFVGGTQFLTIWTLPIDLIGFANRLKGTIFADNKEVGNDNGLDLIGKVIHIADGIGNLTAGLVDVGAVAAQAMSWAGPLALGCSLAGVIFYVINGKSILKNRQFVHLFNKTSVNGPDAVLKLMKNEKHLYRLERHGGVKVSKFTKKIKNIQKHSLDNQTKKIHKSYRALKTRLKWKQVSHYCGMLITSIGIVASIVFFISNAPAFLIAGSSLLVVLYAALIAKMGIEYFANRQFNHAMRLK